MRGSITLERGWCHDPDMTTDYSFLLLILVPSSSRPLFANWTIRYLLIPIDSYCTIVTHPRILVLVPGGYMMTHGLTP